ncbi:serine/threonine protein kinase [Candidatus Bathyarchaeota archaeon]|nr:serine/threonine protein kinase [Candidatus Bathyarchaeota archaeon]
MSPLPFARFSLSELRIPGNGRGYALALCYPQFDPGVLEERIHELEALGITAIEFSGPKLVYDIPVLGKGCVGLVLIAYQCQGERLVLKVRRTDANRSSLEWEADCLKRANHVGVGPRLYGVTKDFILMEYVEGKIFPEWLRTLKGRGKKEKLLKVLFMALEDCFKLDNAGIYHGELSSASKHIIVTYQGIPKILDFESASLSRRASNVTALAQYFLIGGGPSSKVRRILGFRKEDELLEALRSYKRMRSREFFEAIIKTLK